MHRIKTKMKKLLTIFLILLVIAALFFSVHFLGGKEIISSDSEQPVAEQSESPLPQPDNETTSSAEVANPSDSEEQQVPELDVTEEFVITMDENEGTGSL